MTQHNGQLKKRGSTLKKNYDKMNTQLYMRGNTKEKQNSEKFLKMQQV